MPRTEEVEDCDLAEIALEETVSTDITQLDIDTDELVDWVFGEEEDSASEDDDDEHGTYNGSSLEDI